MNNPCIECGGNCCWHEDCEFNRVVPLTVIEDIKAEIRQGVSDFANENGDISYGFSCAENIIDKHIEDMRGGNDESNI